MANVTCADPDDAKQAESFGLMCRRRTTVRICEMAWHFCTPWKKLFYSYAISCTLIHQNVTSCSENTATGCRCQENSLQNPCICVCVCLVVYGSFSLWVNGGGSNKKFARHFTRKLSCTSVEQAFYLFTWTEQLVFLLWELAIRVLVLVSLLQYLSQQCIAQGFFFHVLRDDLRV